MGTCKNHEPCDLGTGSCKAPEFAKSVLLLVLAALEPLIARLGVSVAAHGTHGTLGTLHCQTEKNSVRRGRCDSGIWPGVFGMRISWESGNQIRIFLGMGLYIRNTGSMGKSPLCQLASTKAMKAKPKSLALAKFQQAGQLTIAKNKQTKAPWIWPQGIRWDFWGPGGPKKRGGKTSGFDGLSMFKQEEIGCFEMDMDLDGWDGDGWWVDDG